MQKVFENKQFFKKSKIKKVLGSVFLFGLVSFNANAQISDSVGGLTRTTLTELYNKIPQGARIESVYSLSTTVVSPFKIVDYWMNSGVLTAQDTYLSFNNPVGSGDTTYNFNWGDDGAGNLILNNCASVACTSPYNLTAKANSLTNKKITTTTSTGDINYNFVGLNSTGYGSAIYNVSSTIGDIEAYFVDNQTSVGTLTYGGAIYNSAGTIGDITGAFIGNSTYNGTNTVGGALVNRNSGKIGVITADFIGNFSKPTTADVGAGAVMNRAGTTTNLAYIEGIVGDFIGNYATTNVRGRGGAIYNMYYADIGYITGDFKNNYLSANTEAQGGFLYNAAWDNTLGGTVGIMTGNFIGNYAKTRSVATSSFSQGGAIYNFTGVIDEITGAFVGNYVLANAGKAEGGAIYNGMVSNVGSIVSITADFIDNRAVSTSGSVAGGAIWNSGLIGIDAVDSNVLFKDNYVETGGVKTYNAIYNNAAGVINFSSDSSHKVSFYDSLTGSGKYNILPNTNFELLGENSNFASDSQVSFAGGGLFSTIDGAVRTKNLGVLTINGVVDYGIDVDLTKDAANAGDKIDATSVAITSGGYFNVKNINVIGDMAGNREVLLSTNSAMQQAIGLDANEIFSGSISFYNALSYDKDTGILTIYGEPSSLAKMVEVDNADKVYNMTANENVEEAFGDLQGGSSAKLDVVGNSFAVDGNGFAGINVASGQTYALIDVSDYSDFSDNAIDSAGTVNITANTTNTNFGANSQINNTGVINLEGSKTITFNDVITGSGIINIDTNTVFNNVVSNTVNLDNGVLLFGAAGGLSSGASFNVDALSNGSINLQGNGTNTTSLGNVVLDSNINYSIDIDLTDNSADKFSVTSFAGSGLFVIDDLNVVFQNPSEVPFDINVADASLREHTTLGVNSTIDLNGAAPAGSYLLSYNNANGNITFAYMSLNEAVIAETAVKTYNLSENTTVTGALGAMAGTTLNINGHGYNIVGDNNGGISVASGKNLSFTNVLGVSGFNGAFVTENLGTIDVFAISNNMSVSDEIVNNGALNFEVGSNRTINLGEITGANGSIDVDGSGSIIFNESVEAQNINLDANTATFAGSVNAENIVVENATTEFDGTLTSTGDITVNTGNTTFETVNANNITISSGAGTTSFNNNVNATGNVSLNNSVSFAANVDVNNIAFSGVSSVFDFEGILDATNINITSGVINFASGSYIVDGANLSAVGGLINFDNGEVRKTTFGNVDANIDVAIDIDMAAGTADNFAASGTVDAGSLLTVSELNIYNEATQMPLEVLIADENLKDNVTLASDVSILPSSTSYNKTNYFIGYSDLTGKLSFAYSNLAYAITSNIGQKVYNMLSAENVASALTLGGNTMTINAGGNAIGGSGVISIGSGKVFEIDNALSLSVGINNSGVTTISDTPTISSDFVNNAGGFINIENATSITGSINNLGNIEIAGTDTTISGVVNGSGGVIDISGDALFSASVSGNDLEINSGTTIIENSYSGGEIILGNATLGIENATSFSGASLTTSAVGATLDASNGNIKSLAFDVIDLGADLNYNIDVNLSDLSSDVLNATTVNGAGEIVLKEINVLENADVIVDGVSVDIANDIVDGRIDISSAFITNSTGTTEDYGNYMLGYDKNSGMLSFNYASLEAAVKSIVGQKTYNMSGNVVIGSLVVMGGNDMTINAGSGSISGGLIEVLSSQELNINNATSFATALENAGEINFENVNTIGSTIENNGTINLSGSPTVVNGDIDGVNGVINVNNNATFNGDVLGNNIIVKSGVTEINASISNGELTIGAGTVNVSASAGFSSVDLVTTGGGSLDLSNNSFGDYNFDSISLAGNTNLGIDVNLETLESDKINTSGTVSGSGKFVINDLNITANALNIGVDGVDITVSDKDIISVAQGANLNISNSTGTLENYAGYLISASNGVLNFNYGDLETAISSLVPTKAYAMIEDATIGDLTLSGTSLSIDANGKTISGGSIDVNGKELSLREATLNASVDVGGGIFNLFNDNTINSAIGGSGVVNITGVNTLNADMSGFNGDASLNDGTIKVGDAMGMSGGYTNFFGGNFNVSGSSFLNTNNGVEDIFDATNWNLSSNLNTTIDVNLEEGWGDSFNNTGALEEGKSIVITDIKLISDKEGLTEITVTNTANSNVVSVNPNIEDVKAPIFIYKVDTSQLATTGKILFASEGTEFNPAIYESLVATQSQYLSNITIYKEAFANFGTQTPVGGGMPSGDVLKSVESVWFRPFGKNENVNLDNGYVVDNQTYGALLGIDTKMHFYDDCWNGFYSVYAGYTGSRQRYDETTINQNGFVIGARALFERFNLFSGLTANIGTSFANGKNDFGSEEFNMYSAGLSSKTGVNINLENGKYVVQPSMMMSYTYVNTPGYTNASNVDISSSDLHALQITPEVKFIANINEKWQAYTAAGYNWNVVSSSEVMANDVALPDVAVDPYAEFRLGARKKVNDIETFAEITATTGGREGFGLEVGLKWEF